VLLVQNSRNAVTCREARRLQGRGESEIEAVEDPAAA